ncbi:protein NDR1-like [Bidens hawaiensis]|uniref:protein NDR1-like n=1 Tax=Bidens hawaiensis TaxID=980011 RepID=UPI0040498CC7
MACGGLIACLCIGSFCLGLVVLMPVLLALYASPSSPSFSIDLFDNQAFNMTKADHGSPNNITLHFHLKIKNVNSAIGLHYPDPLKITFSYFPNVSMMVTLADYTVDSFYQGNGKTKDVRDLVETSGVPTVLEGTDLVAFRVDLVGTYRYKKVGTKRHKVDVGCLVGVNNTTSRKLRTGFIGLVQPGLDSQLKPPSTESYGAY